jgi:hypothetical protein
MTLRKPRPPVVTPPPLPKAIPYPPDSIWRTWEEGKATMFRGNLFRRQGHKIARVLEPQAPTE